MDSGPVSNAGKHESPPNDVTTESARISHAADVMISETSSAMKRTATPDVQDSDTQATKRRLETLLQLETHARRTIEENFQRVKGFTFVLFSVNFVRLNADQASTLSCSSLANCCQFK